MSKKNKKGKGSHRLRNFIISVLLIAVIVTGGVYAWAVSLGSPADPESTATVQVNIPQGSATGSIAAILEENGLIDSISGFKIKSRIEGYDGDYKAGVYELSGSMSMEEMMKIMTAGDTSSATRITVPEGSTIDEIAVIVSNIAGCTSDEFIAAAAAGDYDYDFLKGIPAGPKQLEGYLYPDTYDIFANEDPHSIITRMLDRFEEVYTSIRAESKSGSVSGNFSDYQIVTIASLIEKEAKLDSERPLISSVIYNRLNSSMKLQFCSTVQYALGKHKQRLYNSDLEIDSPYNTYKVDGLPAGPIGSPGKASIRAALNPSQTDYLYFVVSAAGDGSHNFAATGDDFGNYREEYLASLAQ